MEGMIEYDRLINRLRMIIRDSLKCEDNELHISNRCKYNVFNLMMEYDYKYMKELLKELEYREISD